MDVMSFSQGLISLNLIFQPTGVFNMSSLIRDDDGVSNTSANDHLHDLIEREIARNPSRRSMLKSGAALTMPVTGR